MGSTDVPSNEVSRKVRIQCTTTDEGLFDFDIDRSQFQQLLTILVDCKYKTAGCITNDYIKDIKEHESKCLYRTITCPIQTKDDLCENISPIHLVEHIKEHHNSDCWTTEENLFTIPIDVTNEIKLSKIITIREDIIYVCRLKNEAHKLHASLLPIINTNNHLNCEITLMADDVKWGNHKIQISNSEFDYFNEQSAEFDLEKLIYVQNIFNSITIRVECNIETQEQHVQSEEVLQKIICACCGDFLTSIYYECENFHMFCETCYDLQDCYATLRNDKKCKKCIGYHYLKNEQHRLTLIDSVKEYKYPCENHSLGCKQYIPRFTSKHELICSFKVFECQKCEFSGKYSEFISHLQETHANEVIASNIHKMVYATNGSCYMFAFGSVFLCSIIDKRTCRIEWLSSSTITHNFKFEVTFNYGLSKKIVLSINLGNKMVHYVTGYYKCVYNRIKKTALFNLCGDVMYDVNTISFRINKT